MDIQIFNNSFHTEVDGISKFIDANNNVVSTSIEDFVTIRNPIKNDENGVLANSVEDSYVKVPSTLVDRLEKEISISDAMTMVDSAEVNSIDVTIEATHNGVLINNCLYTSESMSKDSLSYITPYNKPLILNHNTLSEPIGRVTESSLEDSALLSDTSTILVKCSVSDKESMKKFIDGRYNTVSIGAQARDIRCNLCGKHILKDGTLKFCGHWKGETYKGVKASWTTTDLVYSELSVVNSPADPYAQVRKIKLNGGKAPMENTNVAPDTGENKENQATENTQSDKTEGVPVANASNDDTQAQIVLNEMMKVIQNAGMSTGKETPETTINNKEEDNNVELEALKVKNEELQSLDITNKEEITKLNAKVVELQNSVTEKDKSLVTLVNFNMTLLKENLTLIDNSVEPSTLDTLNATEIQNMITKAKESNKRKEATVENNSLAVETEPKKLVPNRHVINSNKFDDVTLGIWR